MFIEAYNEAMSNKQRIIDDTKEVILIFLTLHKSITELLMQILR